MKINTKQVASISTTLLTAIGVLYMALANIWGLPYGKEVIDTTVALAAAIASILGINTVAKVIDNNHNGIPDELENMDQEFTEGGEK